jgi:DNA-binding transcriptional regulator of glucitol operon
MDRQVWFSRRAIRLHAVILIVVPAFMALCLWQLSRALDGNELSWAYVFEWPLFAAYAVYMWWRFVHEPLEGTPAAGATTDDAVVSNGDPAAAARRAVEMDRRAGEDQELAEYNRYLAELAAHDKPAGQDQSASPAPKNLS